MTQEQLDTANALVAKIKDYENAKMAVTGDGCDKCTIGYDFPLFSFNKDNLKDYGVDIDIPSIEDLRDRVISFCDNKISELKTQIEAL